MSKAKRETDIESSPVELHQISDKSLDTAVLKIVSGQDVVHNDDFGTGDSLLARFQRFAGSYGMEQRGIEWVPLDEREDTPPYRIGVLWFSASTSVPTFALGALAVPGFGLGFVDSMLIIVLMNALGAVPVAIFCSWGPKFGLRQMILTRFFFGYYVAKFLAILQIIVCLGWAAISSVVGAQVLHAVNPNIPGWAGVLIMVFLTFLVGLFGYKVVHLYEQWAGLPCLTIFLIVLGVFAHSGQFNNLLPLSTGTRELSSVLSYSTAIYGYMAGWGSFAADYSVYQPPDRPTSSIFMWSWVGLYMGNAFPELLGLAVATATVHNEKYLAAYSDSGVGGLLSTTLVPTLGRFGDFCMVVLALSIIAATSPVIYSASFSLQALGRATQRIPRVLWTLVGLCVCIALSIPAYDHFGTWLSNLVTVTGYWTSLYIGVLIPEHSVFRRKFSNYQLEDFTNPMALPPGFAAGVAFAIGVMGVVLGMSQTWFTGPISKLCGDPGGDIGFELGLGFTVVAYIALRLVERRRFGR